MLSKQSVYRWRLDCQPYTSAELYPHKSSGTNFCDRLRKPRCYGAAGKILEYRTIGDVQRAFNLSEGYWLLRCDALQSGIKLPVFGWTFLPPF
jgi:hypothetical protein